MRMADHMKLTIWEIWGEVLVALFPLLICTAILFAVVVVAEIRRYRRERRRNRW